MPEEQSSGIIHIHIKKWIFILFTVRWCHDDGWSLWTYHLTYSNTNNTLTSRVSSNDTRQSEDVLKNTFRKGRFWITVIFPWICLIRLSKTRLPWPPRVTCTMTSCSMFLYGHPEDSVFAGEFPVIWSVSFPVRYLSDNLKDSVGLILVKTSTTRVTILIDLSTRSWIPLPRFFYSRRSPPLITSSLVLFPQHSD